MKRAILWLAALAACRTAQPPVVRAPAPEAPDAGAAVSARTVDDDAGIPDKAAQAWARRDTDPRALDEAIALWEDQALRGVDASGALLSAARARKLRIERSAAAAPADAQDALAALAQDALVCAADAHRSWTAQFPSVAALLDGTRTPAEVYAQVPAAGGEALYLESVCTSVWARTQGFTPLVERRLELQGELARAIALDSTLDGGGPERELGALLAALPAYAGGDLDAARAHLDAALKTAPADARNHVALARLAVKAQDRALFLAALNGVDDSAARDLLQRADDLFGPAQGAQPTPGGAGH